MVLVDTSVLIAWLRGHEHPKLSSFAEIADTPLWGISILTYQELLQGTRNQKEYAQLQDYLKTQKIYYLPQELHFYDYATDLYRAIRRRGETIRSIADTLIAVTAVYYGLELLHHDKDFDTIAKYDRQLRIR